MKTVSRLLPAIFLLLVAGCSLTRIAYDNADTALRFTLSEYFDLDGAQSGELKVRVVRLHQWHRASELPVYAALLHEAARRAEKGITAPDVAWGIGNLRARYRRFAAETAGELAPVLATLGTAQLAALEHRFAESNEKYAKEYLPADPARRRRAQAGRTIRRFEDFTGDLTPDQRARIERFVAAHEAHFALRFEDRQRWQHDAVALLRAQRRADELGRGLAELFTRPELRRSEDWVRQEKRWEDDLAQLIVDLDGTLTPKQRAHVVRRLDGYADDCAVLAGKKSEAV